MQHVVRHSTVYLSFLIPGLVLQMRNDSQAVLKAGYYYGKHFQQINFENNISGIMFIAAADLCYAGTFYLEP